MQTKKITLLAFIALIFVTSNSCGRKTLPVDERCNNNIEQVSNILTEKSKSLSRTESQRIQNLIKAAKIQQQYGRFNTCVDKMNRALTLMKEDAISKQPKTEN